MLKTLTTTLLLNLLALYTATASQKAQSPYFQITSTESSLDSLPLKVSEAEVSISGSIAQVELRQTYANTGGLPIEAIYCFPGSTGTAMHGMEMKIGERVIVAKIKKRNQAKAEYEKAKAENKTAALLEQQRPNVFQINIANILPGEEIEVILRYSEHITATEGVYEFIMPTVVGPRYGNSAHNSNENSPEITVNPYLHKSKNIVTEFKFTMDLRTSLPLKQVLCSSHKTPIKYLGKKHASLKINSINQTTAMNRDIIVRYRLADSQVATGLLLHQADTNNGEGDHYFLLEIEPPARVTPEHIPPRDYLFVLDVSGSMSGFPLNTARTLFKDLTQQLRPSDSFNILLFAGNSQILSTHPLVTNKKNITKAIEFINSRGGPGSGGTELVKALDRAVKMPGSKDKSRSIVVVTDGYVNFEADAFDLIRKNRGASNVFCFGIGSSVNRHLVEGIANAGSGEAFIVTKPSEAALTAQRFREYIDSPVLTNVRITTKGFNATDIEHSSIPDVFANRPITITGKWQGLPEGQLILSGMMGNGKPYQQIINVAETAKTNMHNPALPSLWARERVRELGEYIKFQRSEKSHQEVIQEITNIGLTHSLLTNYTSFIAVDETPKPITGDVTSVEQISPLPAGVSQHVVTNHSPKASPLVSAGSVPEPGSATLFIVSIISLLFLRTRR